MRKVINKAKLTEPALFAYQVAQYVHPHDRFLAWTILRWLPAWVTPNTLTVLRIVLTPIVFWLLASHSYTFGVLLFLFASFTDALDGSLARTQDKITNFGILADPLADKLLVGSAVILLVFQNFNIWLGVVILGLEILFILSALTLRIRFKTVRMANLWGKVKMVSQVIAVSLTLFALLLDFPFLLTLAAGVFGLAIGFAVLSLFTHGV
ncbi:MAG: CDP-diacylglycerol--glycerol-3-phosphate 3-phosphatidyltransferase [Candidatus Magasanikbacteria bacterium CG10_big_fil_rev_8_21_14_0_10_42_10]|uniref:CDP-diacylglycerol--glycerol-3-phosphate 3-phosphatidyltransferase n=2 Tax=Candidatus Magasanikiibacteriota TaxID=1752731 RepID=A0A2H0TV51_9BACT|nr:MAG: CDP-diacylglycerol--glycerol-3-phosphate 3-phosphatidyltransferase [Candidatus Magasanikbacteria bacterium CG10_big_fil_rev_8_21_14_0_10_42_10]PIZ92831.1 MAG: CDP-diacylglycerol--glycerol-3-phosphate 3-phosphatidyltransferase [Candidatus Magasanikbacteria bacterium CG_4_10_14_0_2_um_filter_41_10]